MKEQIQSLLKYLGIQSSQYLNRQFKKNTYEVKEDYIIVYDGEDHFMLSKEDKWILDFRYCRIVSDRFGAKYVQLKIYGKRVFLHNALMQPKCGNVIDHINGITLDYRRSNLREVTKHANNLNKKTYKNSKHRGVSKQGNKYIARIQVNKKSVYLGRFETVEEAQQIRHQAEIKYFGEMRREGGIC